MQLLGFFQRGKGKAIRVMTKKCPICGFENLDDAKFCSSCGYSFSSESSSSGPAVSGASTNQDTAGKSRLSRAFDLFMKNLAIVIPSVVLLVVEIILMVILVALAMSFFLFSGYSITSFTAASILAHVISAIVSVVIAVLYFLTLHATMYGAREVIHNRNVNLNSTFERAIPTFHDLLKPVILIIIIGALLGYVDEFLSILVVGVLSVPVYVMSASMILGKSKGFSESINWFIELFNKDGSSAIVILLGSLFSIVPVLNIFAIPYTAELTYISVDEVTVPQSKSV